MFYDRLPCFRDAPAPPEGKSVGRSVFYCCDDHPALMSSPTAPSDGVRLPYTGSLPCALVPGRLVSIEGHIPSTAKSFTVALTCGPDTNANADADVALQLVVHLFPHSFVARNSRLAGKWGCDECAMGQRNRFRRDMRLRLDILTLRTAFYVAVNARHFIKYRHRVPTSQVDTLRISGDLTVRSLRHTAATSYPAVCPDNPLPYDAVVGTQDDEVVVTKDEVVGTKDEVVEGADRGEGELVVPFVGKLAGDHLASGKELVVEGKVELLPCMLYVRLQQGQQHWPPPDVALAVCARYMGTASGDAALGVRTRRDGVWGVETLVPQYPFKPGTRFRLTVAAVGDAYHVHVDGKLLANVKHTLPPEEMARIDTVAIKGCVFIYKVYFNNRSSDVLP